VRGAGGKEVILEWKGWGSSGIRGVRRERSGGEKSELRWLKTLLGSWADDLPDVTVPQERRAIFPASLVTFFLPSLSHKWSEFCLFVKQRIKAERIRCSISGNTVALWGRNNANTFVRRII